MKHNRHTDTTGKLILAIFIAIIAACTQIKKRPASQSINTQPEKENVKLFDMAITAADSVFYYVNMKVNGKLKSKLFDTYASPWQFRLDSLTQLLTPGHQARLQQYRQQCLQHIADGSYGTGYQYPQK